MKSRILLGICAFLVAGAAAANFDPAAHPEYVYMPNNRTWAYQSQNEFVPDPNLGYRHRKNAKIHHVTQTRERVMWDVILNFDSHGNRIVEQENLKERRRFLAFYGCSFVLGTGLGGADTLPTQVAKRILDHKVYNFAQGSSGPNLHLARAEAGEFRAAIAEEAGTFVYVPISAHLGRVNGFYQESMWMGDTPFYEYGSNGTLERAGSLRSARPWRQATYDLLRRAQSKWFPNLVFNFPPLLPSHSRYLCDLVAATASRLKQDFPAADFVVANHPLNQIQPEVIDCFRERGLKVLDFGSWRNEEEKYTIQGDGHPNERFNHDFSAVLARELEPLLTKKSTAY